jgi:hypothetical protein
MLSATRSSQFQAPQNKFLTRGERKFGRVRIELPDLARNNFRLRPSLDQNEHAPMLVVSADA